jgi:flagellar motor component MotA
MSAFGMIVGIIFIGIGFFLAIPHFGIIGVFWTLIAIGITVYHAINVFSEHGVAHEVVEFETDASQPDISRASAETVEKRLEDLNSLREKGLVSEQEYKEQRNRILAKI